ncbi:MAG: polymer-forming cytoskeletal protein [Deltaproteobacteria bacterium]|nr:MAG: polymer-forming cytoskeletal protein [Deltaproteobacteria bacterium]
MARTPTSTAPPVPASTTLGPTIHVRGRILGEEDLRVEGRVDGAIELSETLIVEESGVVLAEIQARDVVVRGIVIGNVTATDSVTLDAGAKLMGDIEAPRVILADGAAFKGSVKVTGAGPRPRARKTSVASASPVARGAGRTTVAGSIPRVRAARPDAPPPQEDEPTVVVRRQDVAPAQKAPKKAPPKPAKAASKKKTAKKKTAKKRTKARPKVPSRKKRKVSRR